jgi:Flp pilus assembly protein TadG
MRSLPRGSAAIEFALVATPLLLLLFGTMEFGRMLWTWQAMQLAGDQTARCVAIGGSACATPSTYAANLAHGYGATSQSSSNVQVNTISAGSSTACSPPSGTAVNVTLSLGFTSPVSTLIPPLARTLTTVSCYSKTN